MSGVEEDIIHQTIPEERAVPRIYEFNMNEFDFLSIAKWSCSEVSNWLRTNGHDEKYIQLFATQKIDGKSLLLMTENDLRQPPLSINVLGDLKRLFYDILELQQTCSPCHASYANSHPPYLPFLSSFVTPEADSGYRPSFTTTSNGHVPTTSSHSHHSRRLRRRKRKVSFVESDSSQLSDATPDDDDPSQSDVKESLSKSSSAQFIHSHQNNVEKPERRRIGGYASTLEPEVGKAVVAMLYVFVVTWVTALVMVIVHDRVPDMEKYPPLPDLFLDNMPHIPWAFEMCEVTGTVLFCLFLGVLFFHKHRFILIRRFLALCGTVFLLRCVTMLITSLSVPGTHLKCNPRPYGDWASRLYNAYLIWKGAGMSIQGVRTCGDYMFSGHTVALTMLNFFVTEYTTRRLYFIHTLSWLLNMFGIFFILAAHEHYSIDVFIAFYITSRLFLYYHTLANNQALMQRDSKRTKVWFPLFSYFEMKVDGIVPNHYEWPITPRRLKKWSGITLKILESKWKEIVPHPNERFFKLKALFFKPTAVTKNE